MPELSMPMSKNFVLRELLRSNAAERDEQLKIEQENPPPEIIDNLRYLVETALQPIRNRLGFPIRINSGYRCPLVNKLVGGSATSQHCRGEAADCELSPRFITDSITVDIRNEIRSRFQEITGKSMRPDVNENFYLFAFCCIHLDELDVDQVIHEYGEGFGRPSWVHISASQRQDKRQILLVGSYTNKRYLKPPLEEALAYGASTGT
jgi:hypothetical protein